MYLIRLILYIAALASGVSFIVMGLLLLLVVLFTPVKGLEIATRIVCSLLAGQAEVVIDLQGIVSDAYRIADQLLAQTKKE